MRRSHRGQGEKMRRRPAGHPSTTWEALHGFLASTFGPLVQTPLCHPQPFTGPRAAPLASEPGQGPTNKSARLLRPRARSRETPINTRRNRLPGNPECVRVLAWASRRGAQFRKCKPHAEVLDPSTAAPQPTQGSTVIPSSREETG